MIETELEPPWASFPEIPQGSIGWRMGDGEEYIYRWFDFVREHWLDQASAMAYLRRHPPAPVRWRSFLMGHLADADRRAHPDRPPLPALAREAANVILLASLQDQGLIADDAAYPVFVRNHLVDGELPPPWTRPGFGESPELVLRYTSRTVGWWARWLATQCPDRDAYLDRHPAPDAWSSTVAQLRAGRATAWQTLGGGAPSLIAAAALEGLLPPPWTGGHLPLDRDVSWRMANDDEANEDADEADTPVADDRDRWHWWVVATFDDPASWHAYLERWPPTEAWREPLTRAPLRGLGRGVYLD